MEESYCYEDRNLYCRMYGRLYTWLAAMYACPEGWHLPSTAEFQTLFAAVGGEDIAGTVLKSKSGWYNNGNGTNAFGFSALPAGVRVNYGVFLDAGNGAYFWSATEYDSSDAYGMYLYYNDDIAYLDYDDESTARSVRCLRDSK